jgi:hypothetical protein
VRPADAAGTAADFAVVLVVPRASAAAERGDRRVDLVRVARGGKLMGRVIWTLEMTDHFRRLRRRGLSILICAEKLGVGYTTAVVKARQLGLSERMNRGAVAGASREARP